ncbi:MAG TPA: hypothetical protein VJC37_07475 [Planctomycetota bacterium]|nr:hypothetical protein [Planctomycetota bacterium]
MKYLLILVACIALASIGFTGYLYLNPECLLGSLPKNQPSNQVSASGGNEEFNARIKQLQDELFNIRNIANQQALDIAKLTANNSRIDDIYRKLKEIQAGLPNAGKSGVANDPAAPEFQAGSAEAFSGNFSPELFQNPEFAKLFVGKVEEAIKIIEEKQRAEQVKRNAEQLQKRITQRIDEFAKAQNLNDYQKQELTKIISDRAAKSLELSAQMRQNSDSGQQLSPEQMRAQMDTIRTESNEKVKQVLLPNQYEEYQKVENSITGNGRGMGRGPGAQPPQGR